MLATHRTRCRLEIVRSSKFDLTIPRLLSGLLGLLPVAALVISPGEVRPAAPDSVNADKLLVVDCMLPGQVRRLGGAMNYLGPRRAVRTTEIDCEIRGGEYVEYDRADYATSLRVWLPLAEHGDAKAQVYVGEIYEKGLGIPPDYVQAAAWYEKAAKLGDAQGLNHSAYLYEQGLGVAKDTVRALNLYRSAAGIKSDELTFVSEVNAVRDEAQAKIDALSAQLDERNQSAEALAEKLDETRRELADQRTVATRAEHTAAELRKRSAQLQTAPATTANTKELDRVKADLADREMKLSEERAKTEALERTYSTQDGALRGRLTEAEKEDALLRQQLGAAQAQSASDRSQLAAAQAKGKVVDQEVRDLRAQMKANESAVGLAQERLRVEQGAQNNSDRARAEALKSTVAQQQVQLDRQKTVVASLEEQRLKLDAEIHRLESVVASQSAKGNAAHAQDASDAAGLRAQLASTQSELIRKTVELKDLSAKLDADERQMRLEQGAQNNSDRARAEALKSTVAQQQVQLDRQKTVAASLEEQRLKLDAEIHRLESVVAAAQTQSAKESQAHAQDTATAASLRAQLASTQSEFIRKTVELKDLSAKLDADERQIALDNRALSAAVADAGSKDASVQRLNGELAKREASVVEQRAQLAALQDTVTQDHHALEDYRLRLSKNVSSGTRGGTTVGVPVSGAPNSNGTASIGGDGAIDTKRPPEKLPEKLPELGLGQNYALIIGNTEYAHLPHLKSATKDAQDVERVLSERYGFKGHTRLLLNATRDQIMNALNDLMKVVGERDSLVIYYAGHGALDETNLRGYWLPIDADRDNPTNWVPDRSVTDMISLMSARHVLIVADSCYSGAMLRGTNLRLTSASTESAEEKRILLLAKLRSRTVLTSGGNEPVLDSGPDGHSIFAREFIDVLASNTKVLEAASLYYNVSDRVHSSAMRLSAMTGATISQSPRYSVLADAGHLNGEFLFVPAPPRGAPAG
jgi:hypothetical protein